MKTTTQDQEIVVRVGCFRVIFWPIEGGMSVENFSKRHNGHPQGDWLLAHEDDHDLPDAREALRIAYHIRDN